MIWSSHSGGRNPDDPIVGLSAAVAARDYLGHSPPKLPNHVPCLRLFTSHLAASTRTLRPGMQELNASAGHTDPFSNLPPNKPPRQKSRRNESLQTLVNKRPSRSKIKQAHISSWRAIELVFVAFMWPLIFCGLWIGEKYNSLNVQCRMFSHWSLISPEESLLSFSSGEKLLFGGGCLCVKFLTQIVCKTQKKLKSQGKTLKAQSNQSSLDQQTSRGRFRFDQLPVGFLKISWQHKISETVDLRCSFQCRFQGTLAIKFLKCRPSPGKLKFLFVKPSFHT